MEFHLWTPISSRDPQCWAVLVSAQVPRLQQACRWVPVRSKMQKSGSSLLLLWSSVEDKTPHPNLWTVKLELEALLKFQLLSLGLGPLPELLVLSGDVWLCWAMLGSWSIFEFHWASALEGGKGIYVHWKTQQVAEALRNFVSRELGERRLLLLPVSLPSPLHPSSSCLALSSGTQPPPRGVPPPLLVRKPVVQLRGADFWKRC